MDKVSWKPSDTSWPAVDDESQKFFPTSAVGSFFVAWTIPPADDESDSPLVVIEPTFQDEQLLSSPIEPYQVVAAEEAKFLVPWAIVDF